MIHFFKNLHFFLLIDGLSLSFSNFFTTTNKSINPGFQQGTRNFNWTTLSKCINIPKIILIGFTSSATIHFMTALLFFLVIFYWTWHDELNIYHEKMAQIYSIVLKRKHLSCLWWYYATNHTTATSMLPIKKELSMKTNNKFKKINVAFISNIYSAVTWAK